MINLPPWLNESFERSICPQCKKHLNKKGVYGIGIRREGKKEKLTMFYEYLCQECKKRSIFPGFPVDWDSFIGDLIDISQYYPGDGTGDPTEPPKSKSKKRQGISNVEVDDVLKDLKESEDFRDFLRKIGIILETEGNTEDDESK